jgi:hypothetical protein
MIDPERSAELKTTNRRYRMATNFEVRLLLALWDLGGASVRKGDLNGRFSGKVPEANAACASLMQLGAIEASENGRSMTLTSAGKMLLMESLSNEGFKFEAQIGAKTANALLMWLRTQFDINKSSVVKELEAKVVNESVPGNMIDSYEIFKSVVLDAYARLNRDFNLDDLVPIYRIRRDIGDRATRQNFDRWLLIMQADDIFQLQGGSVPDGDAAKIEDSIITELSGLRCYATLLNS